MKVLVYMYLVVAGSPVTQLGTFSNLAQCNAAAAQALVPKEMGTPPGWFLLCVTANDPAVDPPKR